MGNIEEKIPHRRQAPFISFLRIFDFRNIVSRYILREHIGPFIFAFVIITFILIIDFIPHLVDLIVGKELPTMIILKVFVFQMGWIIALSVPMSVLVATLMAFGRMTGDFEVVALMASGTHILRLMYPVILAACLLSWGMVYFSNEVLPDLNHRARILMQDIKRMRPTLQMRSGAFVTDIPGYIILIDSVDHKTSNLTGVKIMELGKKRTAPRTIVSKTGHLTFAADGRELIFDLKDGEIHEFDNKNDENYRRLAFNTQRFQVTDVSRDFKESDDQHRTDREKSSMRMLDDIMKWEKSIRPYRSKIGVKITQRFDRLLADSLAPSPDSMIADNIALDHLARDEDAAMKFISRENESVSNQQKMINSYYVEVYKKYSIPTACIVFVLIGAPLGIMAKRGGMGISIGISLGLFIVYWAFLIGGEDLADRSIVTPFWAMWSANILIGSIGIGMLYLISTEKTVWELISPFRHLGKKK